MRAVAVEPTRPIAVSAQNAEAGREVITLHPKVESGPRTHPGFFSMLRSATFDMVDFQEVNVGFTATNTLQTATPSKHLGLDILGAEFPRRLPDRCFEKSDRLSVLTLFAWTTKPKFYTMFLVSIEAR
jgi:hypothetical protein